MHSSRSHDAVIRVYEAVGNVIEMHEHKGEFKEWRTAYSRLYLLAKRAHLDLKDWYIPAGEWPNSAYENAGAATTKQY